MTPHQTAGGEVTAAWVARTWASGIAVALAWCVVLGLAARVVWRRGCLQYTGGI